MRIGMLIALGKVNRLTPALDLRFAAQNEILCVNLSGRTAMKGAVIRIG